MIEFLEVEYGASHFLVLKASSPGHTAQNSVNVHSLPSARTWCLKFTLIEFSLGEDLRRFCSLDDVLIFEESAGALVNVAMRLKTCCVNLFNFLEIISSLFTAFGKNINYVTSKSYLKEQLWFAGETLTHSAPESSLLPFQRVAPGPQTTSLSGALCSSTRSS